MAKRTPVEVAATSDVIAQAPPAPKPPAPYPPSTNELLAMILSELRTLNSRGVFINPKPISTAADAADRK